MFIANPADQFYFIKIVAAAPTPVAGVFQTNQAAVGTVHIIRVDGRLNLFGALRTSMATCGYETVKEFQKAEVMVAPALRTEGKSLQQAQGVGMG